MGHNILDYIVLRGILATATVLIKPVNVNVFIIDLDLLPAHNRSNFMEQSEKIKYRKAR